MNDNEHARSTADAVARRSYGKLVAFLAARSRDVAAAEDALADAFAVALAMFRGQRWTVPTGMWRPPITAMLGHST